MGLSHFHSFICGTEDSTWFKCLVNSLWARASCLRASATPVFTDDFESGALTGWTNVGMLVQGSEVYGGNFAVRVDGFDAAALAAYLRGHGVEVGELRERYGAEGYGPSLYISDPDGNTVELKGPATRGL